MFNDRFDAKTMNDVAKQAREEESKHKASDFIAVIKRQIKKDAANGKFVSFLSASLYPEVLSSYFADNLVISKVKNYFETRGFTVVINVLREIIFVEWKS